MPGKAQIFLLAFFLKKKNKRVERIWALLTQIDPG